MAINRLITQDSKLQLLALSVRQALINAFSNGHCKTIVNQMCYMLLTCGLCDTHKLSVHWYVSLLCMKVKSDSLACF